MYVCAPYTVPTKTKEGTGSSRIGVTGYELSCGYVERFFCVVMETSPANKKLIGQ